MLQVIDYILNWEPVYLIIVFYSTNFCHSLSLSPLTIKGRFLCYFYGLVCPASLGQFYANVEEEAEKY